MLPCPAVPIARRSETLYDAVALAMSTYASAAFRLRVLGPVQELGRSELVVATHRAESDVPLICSAFYWHAGVRHRGGVKLHFAARDDMFERGFFAGFPARLPIAARRLLYPLDAGPYLPLVRVLPLPYPSPERLRLGRAVGALDPATPLEGVVPADALACLQRRAREQGRGEPRSAGDVLHGDYADLLWRDFDREALAAPALDAVWSRRREEAVAALRALVDLVRSGEPVLFFPEGRPSPDGAIGPLRQGVELLVRRGRPAWIVPVGLAYDRFTRGRPRACLTIGEPFRTPADDVEGAMLRALRLAVPLTCGQVVCAALVEAAGAGDRAVSLSALASRLAGAVEAASAERRRFEPELQSERVRRDRLDDCVGALVRAGVVEPAGRRSLALEPPAVLAGAQVLATAREHESARGR